ncbi:MAG: hypothetical protein IH849_07340 [Acidobacteria bacterium]|nr:hypothetical protein [Acidobacteriota bacterium]
MRAAKISVGMPLPVPSGSVKTGTRMSDAICCIRSAISGVRLEIMKVPAGSSRASTVSGPGLRNTSTPSASGRPPASGSPLRGGEGDRACHEGGEQHDDGRDAGASAGEM